MRTRSLSGTLAAALCAGLVAIAAGCGGEEDETGLGVPEDAPAEIGDFAREWPAPNGDYQNSRVGSTTIDSGNVATLGIAWTAPITATGTFGGYASTPIIADGVVYTQDLSSNVKAYDLQTGERLWQRLYDDPTVGPNGVAIGYGKVYGATATEAFALDMETGEEVWRSKRLTRNANEGIDMAPLAYDGKVYVSTVPGNVDSFYKGNGVGVLHALDAETGDPEWSFLTVPEDLWDPEHTEINSGGGLWHPPGFDANGDMYVSVANPAPWPGTKEFPWGTSRPGENLYSNSLLKLDPDDGELEWYYQALPHDVWDWDLHLPPIIANDGDRKLVVTGGKMGYVYAVDTNGDLAWKTPVGIHNGRDDDNALALEGELDKLPEFPVTIWPGVLGGVETQMAVEGDTIYAPVVNLPTTFTSETKLELGFAEGSGELVALDLATGAVRWKTTLPQPPYGAATVANDLVLTTTFDGVVWALDRETGAIVWRGQLPAGTNATVAVAGDWLLTAASFPQSKQQKAQIVALQLGAGEPLPEPAAQPGSGGGDEGEGGGEEGGGEQGGGEQGGGEQGGGASEEQLAAGKEVFSASCGSCHTLADAGTSGSVGPNLDEAQPAAAAVETKVRNGGGGMPAFEGRLTDDQIAAVAAYVAEAADPGAEAPDAGSSP